MTSRPDWRKFEEQTKSDKQAGHLRNLKNGRPLGAYASGVNHWRVSTSGSMSAKGFSFGVKMEIQKFIAPDNCEIRTVVIDDEPWMSAGDICTALGIADMRQAVEKLDEDERGVFIVPTPGGPQKIRSVSESGMYALILQSRKPEAKAFKRWVTFTPRGVAWIAGRIA